LAWRLGLPEREFPEHELQIEAVLRWLREHEFWLLGVDNLDQPVVEAMQRWLPPGLPGHVLITSRAAIGSARLQIDPLPLEMAVSFLLSVQGRLTGRLPAQWRRQLEASPLPSSRRQPT
jgi:hypothetical protein